MKRRTFLQVSATGIGVATLPTAGCSSLFGPSGPSDVDDSHLVFVDGVAKYELAPRDHEIRVLDASGNVVRKIGGDPSRPDHLNYPIAGAVGSDGRLLVVDRGNGRVVAYEANGDEVAAFLASRGRSGLRRPTDLAIAADGHAFVTDTGNDRIVVLDRDGKVVRDFGAELNRPRGITIDCDGNVHCVDSGNARVVVFSQQGEQLRTYGERGDAPGKFLLPRSISTDGKGRIYVGDPSAGFVNVFTEGGKFVEREVPQHADGSPAVPLELSYRKGSKPYVWSDGHLSRHAK